MSKQEAPSVGPGHGMDRNNLPPKQKLCPFGGRLPAPSSTPNLLRHVGTSPTVAEATPSKRPDRPDPFDAHQ